MSTSVRNLTGIQILFKRPSIALGVLFIIGMILFKPTYKINMFATFIKVVKLLCFELIYKLGVE